jgi:hypothetical protein
MNLKLLALVVAITAISPVFAAGEQKAARNACITRDACVARGISHGWSSTQAGHWCERNRISETCYK